MFCYPGVCQVAGSVSGGQERNLLTLEAAEKDSRILSRGFILFYLVPYSLAVQEESITVL